MEANKMPERIYLFDFNDAMVTPLEGDTVYVREDAFIEKACKFFSNEANIPLWESYANFGCNTSKLVEIFKNYMKGE